MWGLSESQSAAVHETFFLLHCCGGAGCCCRARCGTELCSNLELQALLHTHLYVLMPTQKSTFCQVSLTTHFKILFISRTTANTYRSPSVCLVCKFDLTYRQFHEATADTYTFVCVSLYAIKTLRGHFCLVLRATAAGTTMISDSFSINHMNESWTSHLEWKMVGWKKVEWWQHWVNNIYHLLPDQSPDHKGFWLVIDFHLGPIVAAWWLFVCTVFLITWHGWSILVALSKCRLNLTLEQFSALFNNRRAYTKTLWIYAASTNNAQYQQ